MPSVNAHLQEKLDALPDRPGVYCFKNERGHFLYVGKAKVLRNRVRSYFQESRSMGPRIDRMVARITDLETIVTDSEIEALILEANMVREHRPRYNVELKDDKSFPYIRVTNEPYPRVFSTRKIIQDGSLYFGPYTSVHYMRKTLKTLGTVFPIRSCKFHITADTIQRKKVRLCLDYYIHKCPGPCEGLVTQDAYGQIVKRTVDFLNGKHSTVLRFLKAEMQTAAESLDYEQAARLRDQIRAVEHFTSGQNMVLHRDVDMDIFALAREGDIGMAVIFRVREGKIVGRFHFQLQGMEDQPEGVALKAVLQQYYLQGRFVPDEILLPAEVEDAAMLEQWLREKREAPVAILIPKIGSKAQLVALGGKNANLLLDELTVQRSQRGDFTPASLTELQKYLGLAKTPRRIEGFDISNISGTDAVASMVVFENSTAKKSEYRRFKIRTVQGPDDFAMMKEAVSRRYRRLLQESKDLPDLILVDGGKGQLGAACEALQTLGITDQPIAGLAKRFEEVYLPGMSEPQSIPKTSPGLKLLQRVRDESHRFANAYHRSLRKKRTIASVLDAVPGIGKQRQLALIDFFGSVKRLAGATPADIARVPGIGVELAKTIADHVAKPVS